MILNATPYDLGLPRLRYVSAHWWRESVPERERINRDEHGAAIIMRPINGPYGDDDIFSRIAWSIDRRGPFGPLPANYVMSDKPTAVLIDREGTDAETLVKVLQAFAELLPTCFRVVYDSDLRVVYPGQAPAASELIAFRDTDPHEKAVGQLAHAFAVDCYLMGIPNRVNDSQSPTGLSIDRYAIDSTKSFTELPVQLDLTKQAAQAYEGITGRPVWPCVHERYHHGKGCGQNICQTMNVWRDYNHIVGERWPGPRVWWSGSMRANPGDESDGWIVPSEHDLRRYAEAIR